jgi:hypothetical protein
VIFRCVVFFRRGKVLSSIGKVSEKMVLSITNA